MKPEGGYTRGNKIALGGIGLAFLGLIILGVWAFVLPDTREEGSGERTDVNGRSNTTRGKDPKPSAHHYTARVSGECTFSSALPLDVWIVRYYPTGKAYRVEVGRTPSRYPLDIPRCALWAVTVDFPVDMNALAREMVTKRIPGLQINDTARVTDGDLVHLKGLTGLLYLRLARTKITNAGLAHLKGLTGLQDLSLWGTEITDAGLAHLKGMTALQELRLYSSNFTDEGLVHLRDMTGLKRLHCGGAKITDAGLAHLKGLTGLRELYLGGMKITDAGLAHLEGLTGLQDLSLWGTEITDAGLAHLKGLTRLQQLNLNGTEITDAGLAELRKALPKTNISR